jgi:hypothetical protein
MLEKPILSGRIGKWAYALIELEDTPRVATEIFINHHMHVMVMIDAKINIIIIVRCNSKIKRK